MATPPPPLVPRSLVDGMRQSLHLVSALAELPASWRQPNAPHEQRLANAEVARRSGLLLFEASGSPTAIGSAGGHLLGGPTRRLLSLMRWSPTSVLAGWNGRAEQLCAGVGDAHRSETAAWAEAAGCDPELLLRANAVADTCCTAVVAASDRRSSRPLMIGRNLDFFPAAALGTMTMVALLRRSGALPIVSIAWPGYTGVLSGMNGAGICACVLLNMATSAPTAGEPIAYRTRTILEHATTLEQAIAAFSEGPVASSHYLLLADEEHAVLLWQESGGVQRHDLRAGWLIGSNGARDATGAAIDDRGRYLHRRCQQSGPIDAAWIRATMGGCYLPGINAQAMLFTPARRQLELALGDAFHPAARSRWTQIELAAALAGSRLATSPICRLKRAPGLPHYGRAV
jgi:hypothetical protein